MKTLSDIGLVGLAVMGENLILNMASKGYTVTAYNRSIDKVDNFLAGRAQGKSIRGAHSIEELVASLAKPRKIMLMVKAGKAVDDFIEQLIPHLEPGDIIFTGTPAGVGELKNGDMVDVEIEGLGKLSNPVKV